MTLHEAVQRSVTMMRANTVLEHYDQVCADLLLLQTLSKSAEYLLSGPASPEARELAREIRTACALADVPGTPRPPADCRHEYQPEQAEPLCLHCGWPQAVIQMREGL